MRVLVVEDEVRLAATLQDLLELNGYTVDVCHDGEAGLDNALTSIYDVILLDVMLPKLDGFTVLRRLRAEGSTTPVLMLTARSELTDRVNGLDSGADYYLTKPFEPKELLASEAEDNNVEVYISFLRKKLDHLHSQVKIRTIRMVGYCLEAPEEA